MLPAFPNVTTQIELDNDIDLDDLKSSVLSNKLVMLKWIKTTEKQLKDEIKRTKSKILTESKKEINYVDEILKEKLSLDTNLTKLTTKDKTKKRCSFTIKNKKNKDKQECKRANLPYSNYCIEHIAQNEDQQLFKRCTFKLEDNPQCSNQSLLNENVCKKHSSAECANELDGKAKSKRKYVKNSTSSSNENKPRKSRKKKENQLNEDNKNDNNIVNNNHLINSSLNNSIHNLIAPATTTSTAASYTKSFTFTSSSTCYSNENSSQFNYSNLIDHHHGLIDHYSPCITNTTNNENLNQLSNLNHSEDSLVAIVNNSDELSAVPFEESELTEMLGKIGKIPEDAFNDLFMDNLSTESSELRAIDNVAFNRETDNLEPSISNHTFTTSLNFKAVNVIANANNSTNSYFSEQLNTNGNGLLFNNQHSIDLNSNGTVVASDNLITSNHEMICLPNNLSNNLISSVQSDQIKNMNDHFSSSSQTIQNSNYNSFNILDYKQSSTIQPFSSPILHSNYTNNSNFNQTNHTSNYQQPQQNSTYYSSSTMIQSQNHLLNNDGNQTAMPTTATTILNGHSNYSTNFNNQSSSNYLDCPLTIKNEIQDKKFNLFANYKNKNYSTNNYSNIYDDLPSFESNQSNRPNAGSSSLPSFSIMIKKNRIESR